ncbi:hypothetical protein ACH5RR_015859 [Cinchona calisaya]|uniref:Uncharacterized protein n=1 Tax=Cinchona calisaya TaxID=153742 RepID=A0ABD2ZU97_9GENT
MTGREGTDNSGKVRAETEEHDGELADVGCFGGMKSRNDLQEVNMQLVPKTTACVEGGIEKGKEKVDEPNSSLEAD